MSEVIHSDCLEALRRLPDNSIDSIISDPPAGISFMNKEFDHDKGGRVQWVAWLSEVMKEALRVLKPGGHALIWALPRTSHWTATALEDAGFEIRDKVYHQYSPDTKLAQFYDSLSQEQRNVLEQIVDSQEAPKSILALFGSGFPKSLSISKQLDRMQGMEREVISEKLKSDITGGSFATIGDMSNKKTVQYTAPASEDAKRFAHLGTALKPACEEWILCRKPISECNIALNVLRWGTGALNIDQSRITSGDELGRLNKIGYNGWKNSSGGANRAAHDPIAASGRFPSHLLLSHTLFCIPLGTQKVKSDSGMIHHARSESGNVYAKNTPHITKCYADADGLEEIDAYDCAENCPVRLLNEQSGNRKSGGKSGAVYTSNSIGSVYANGLNNITSPLYADQGGASRYFKTFPPEIPPFYYTSKASRKERNIGCGALALTDDGRRNLNSSEWTTDNRHPDGGYPKKDLSPALQNTHPTVKSQALCKYLISLINPQGGIVLDMFAGSGSTGVACVSLGYEYILIEKEQEYIDIINARLAYAHNEVRAS